jgi:uncharacterized protein YnzC (UPF0291/DUF896 family)
MKATSFLSLFMLTACAMEPEKRRDPDLQNMHQLRQCYLESDTYNVKKTAEIKISILIDQNGDVEDTKIVRSNVKDPNLESCLMTNIKSKKFATHENGVSVERTEEFKFHTRIP